MFQVETPVQNNKVSVADVALHRRLISQVGSNSGAFYYRLFYFAFILFFKVNYRFNYILAVIIFS